MSFAFEKEVQEIKKKLSSNKTKKKIKGIKSVIKHMNNGKNLGEVYFDVIKCL